VHAVGLHRVEQPLQRKANRLSTGFAKRSLKLCAWL
jgi:hypothetical protein